MQCPMLCEVCDDGTVKVIYGEKSIQSHLKQLNSDVRDKLQVHMVWCCIFHFLSVRI